MEGASINDYFDTYDKPIGNEMRKGGSDKYKGGELLSERSVNFKEVARRVQSGEGGGGPCGSE